MYVLFPFHPHASHAQIGFHHSTCPTWDIPCSPSHIPLILLIQSLHPYGSVLILRTLFFFLLLKNWLAQHYTATVISTTVIRRKYLCLVNCVFLTVTFWRQGPHLPFISQSKRHSQSVSPIGLGGMLSHNKLAEPCGASITHASFPSVQSFPGEGTFSKIVLLPPEWNWSFYTII